ncbi:MAG: FAD-binding oxidoreductase [Pseudomonadales bacterium]
MSSDTAPLLTELGQRLGPGKIETDAGRLAYFSGDFSEILLERPAAVVRPGSLEEVVVIVKAARAHGVSVVPRGGGMSSSLGYTPARPGAVLLDMRALDRIVDIDNRNLTVTVEAGVTWKQLHEALLPTGYRIGFMGTLSGVAATIGGQRESLRHVTVSRILTRWPTRCAM